MRLIALLMIVLALTACASTPDANYSAYLQAQAAADQREHLVRASVADAAASCQNDPTCVVAVAGFAAMAVQGGEGSRSQLQPYVRQAGAAERITLGVLGALPGLAQVYATVESGRNSVAIARINAERETAVVDALAGVTGDVANAFALLPPSTQIDVGGDYITGTQHVGDTVGGDQHIGDTAIRDQIGGNQHLGDAIGGDDNSGNSGAIGSDNRIESPGPWDNSGQCTGELCQGEGDTNPPPPAPEPTP